jgi:hypothetical protein
LRDILATMTPEERMQGLSAEERLRGLTAEGLRKLPPAEVERFRRLLQGPPQGEGTD